MKAYLSDNTVSKGHRLIQSAKQQQRQKHWSLSLDSNLTNGWKQHASFLYVNSRNNNNCAMVNKHSDDKRYIYNGTLWTDMHDNIHWKTA